MRYSGTLVLLLAAVASTAAEPKDATTTTRQANERVRERLSFADRQSFEDAHHGLVAPLPQEVIRTEAGSAVWDPNKYAFVEEGEDCAGNRQSQPLAAVATGEYLGSVQGGGSHLSGA